MIKRLVSTLSLIGGSVFAQIARAQSSICTLNGQSVSCDELPLRMKGFLGAGIAAFGVAFVIGIAATVFSIMMIVHVATKPVQNKAMWVIIMLLFSPIGAIIYYFMVKRPFDKQIPPTSTVQ
ncbi:MAG: PLDc N-terminal domain-containing protein [bacterium]|nr:PLDc N-terminal domain-containing protein [bacterium]